MTVSLGQLFRRMATGDSSHEIPLSRELALLDDYLAIESVRFRDRLTVEFEVDPEARDASVPQFLLQPLVENAIRHGFEPAGRRGRIVVRADRSGDELVLAIIDDGDGLLALNGQATAESGVGLKNTRERLSNHYGDGGFSFKVADRSDGTGTIAEVRIPFNLAEKAAIDR